MKVAFILGVFPSLSETFILDQITGLIDLDCGIDIYARKKFRGKVIQKNVIKYDLMNKTFYFSEFSNTVFRILTIMKDLIIFFLKNWKNIFLILKLFKIVKQELSLEKLYLSIQFLSKNYDIIHCHFGHIGSEYGVFLKKLRIKGKIITSFYGFDLTSIISNQGTEFYKDLFKYGDIFLPICNYFKQKLINLGCDEKKIIIHPLGIDIKKFIPRSKNSSLFNSTVKILSVGRLVEKKGHEYSITAISELKSRGYNLKFNIVGDGPLKSKLSNMISDLNLEKYVKLMGALERKKIIDLYRKMDIFILPSITAKSGNQEGTPTALLEAQVMSLPVISTLHSGIPEVVINEKSGFLVEEGNLNAIIDRLEILINNPNKRLEMGEFGRRLIIKNHDIRKLNLKLLEIYMN